MRRTRATITWVLAALLAVGLSGCGNNPDNLFKKGKYAEAYPEFVKRGGINESALKNEVVNGSFETRNQAGNQAIHDYFYAGECQRRLGNEAEARAWFQRVVALGQYEIRVPHDRAKELKDGFDRYVQALRAFRSREEQLSSGGSQTDPWATGSQTDPPATTDDTTYRLAYDALVRERRDFERLLYTTSSTELAEADGLRREYDRLSRTLDSYLMVAAPYGTLRQPNSLASRMTWMLVESDISSFSRVLYPVQSRITYTVKAMQLAEPGLVAQAAAALQGAPQTPGSPGGNSPASVFSPKNQALAELVVAEKAMLDAFNRYQQLINGQGDSGQIQAAAAEYQRAKARFDELKRKTGN